MVNIKRRKQNIRIVFACISMMITLFTVNIFNTYSTILNNKLALLQLENDNTSYMFYKLLSNNRINITLYILLFGFIITYLIVRKNFKENGGKDNE